jgi:hypothetical protein
MYLDWGVLPFVGPASRAELSGSVRCLRQLRDGAVERASHFD